MGARAERDEGVDREWGEAVWRAAAPCCVRCAEDCARGLVFGRDEGMDVWELGGRGVERGLGEGVGGKSGGGTWGGGEARLTGGREEERAEDGAHEAVVVPHYAGAPAYNGVAERDLKMEKK